ncbi:hypothetical protein BH11BAC3_BH11BAC3_36520 [soil metagenome]
MKLIYPVYNEDYCCYYNDEFIGIATYTNNQLIGDSFIRMVVNKTGVLEEEVLLPDFWEVISSF